LAIASKAKRLAAIVVLMLVGLCVILFGWGFFVDHILPTPVGLHSFAQVDVGSWDKGFVSAEGTWQAERKHDRILYLTLNRPLNISKITCVRQSGFCEVVTATLDQSSGGYYLSMEAGRAEIKDWNRTTLEFSVGDPSFQCFIETYVINRSTNAASGKCDVSKGAPATDMEPLKLSFVGGSDLAVKNRLDEHASTLALIRYIVATTTIAWLLFSAIWIVRVIRR
jgi:hypothetical protein